MGLKLMNGDYVPDGIGGFARLTGREALAQRVMYRLIAHRGSFPFRETLGSELYRLGQYPPGQRAAAAERAVTEALAEETDLQVKRVTLTEEGERAQVCVVLSYQGTDLSVSVSVQ